MEMQTIFLGLTLATMFLVLVSLAGGIAVMAKGSEANKKYGNRFMKARVYLQGLALFFFFLTVIS
jgi:hypothetical protein